MKQFLILLSLLLVATAQSVVARDMPTMTKDELKGQLGAPELIILDVRTGRDWSASEFKIPGAIRAQPEKLEEWSATLPKDKTLVLYCACPYEATSTILAEKLQEKGFTKVHSLKGGWRDWFRSRYPVEDKL